MRSVVAVRAKIPQDAFTATALGTEREGSGVVIRDDGLVLTIGYLVTEADEIWLTTHRELSTSRRIRAVYDALGEALAGYLRRPPVAA